ncbi:MAG TPA: WYL domain-containing protein, partial [bacterium]|nr:WYL domain-containing protein [bacterium]
VIETVRAAVREHRTLEMTYFSMSRRAESVRRVDPWRLWWTEHGLYLVAFCHVHGGEPRTFAVERIRRLRATFDRFHPREELDWNEYVRGVFGVYRGAEARVVVHFSARVAPLVRERRWHESQELMELPGGEVGLAMRVAGIDEVARWILSFGGEARAIEPPDLVRRVRAEAEAIRASHEHSGRAVAPAEARAARSGRRGPRGRE